MSGEVVELEQEGDALPDGWCVSSLGEVSLGKGEYGANVPKAEFDPALPRYIRITDISDQGSLIPTSLVSISHEAAAGYLLEEGDLLFARSGATVGKSFLYQSNYGPCAFAGYLIRFRLDPTKIEPYFARNIVQSSDYWDWVATVQRAQAQPNINAKEYATLPLMLPPLDEQRRIADVLRSVDEAIAAADGVISQLQETRGHRLETLMAMTGTYRRIDEVCRLSGGFGFPIKHQGKVSGRYPFAKVSDMNRTGNEVQMCHAENYVDEADLRTLKAKTFPVGTTFFPKVGATLLTNKRRIAAVEMLVDNNVMGAVATDIDPWFLYYAFCTIDMADYVQPGAVPSVNQRTIGQIMIPVPDRAAQEEFVETMRDLDAAIEVQSGALTQVTATKQALMSDLLTGHVRVPA